MRTLSEMLSDLFQEVLDGTLWGYFMQEVSKRLELWPLVVCQLH